MPAVVRAMIVGDLMATRPVSVRADSPASVAAKLLDDYDVSGLPVVDRSGALVGVVSRCDLVRARANDGLWHDWPELLVRDLMTAPAVTTTIAAPLGEAARVMGERHIRRLIVVDAGGAPVGVLSATDLVHDIACRRGSPA